MGSIFFWYIVKFQNLPIPIKNKLIPTQVAKKIKIHNISSFTAKKSNKCNELNVLVLGWIFYIFKSSIIQVWISLISIRCDSVLKISNISEMSSVWFNYFFKKIILYFLSSKHVTFASLKIWTKDVFLSFINFLLTK